MTAAGDRTNTNGGVGALMRQSASLTAFLLDQSRPLIADLTDLHRDLAPHPGSKTPGWLLGHLAITGDFLRRKCGLAPLTPKAWGPVFAPGTGPAGAAAAQADMAELRDRYVAVYEDLVREAPSFSPDRLDVANPLDMLRGRLPRLQDFAVHILTTHLGWHLGQLQSWRVAAGLS